uniref:(northern house mosquito) hypothetical protein n=1 Tax=Culex pipiens TaxID=7175 RepID=A0A8D8K7S6_CULPI
MMPRSTGQVASSWRGVFNLVFPRYDVHLVFTANKTGQIKSPPTAPFSDLKNGHNPRQNLQNHPPKLYLSPQASNFTLYLHTTPNHHHINHFRFQPRSYS